MNHSCEPNLKMIPVRVNTMVPHLALVTNKHVKKVHDFYIDLSPTIFHKGDELCFDYAFKNNEDNMNVKDESNVNNFLVRTKCCCASKNCRQYLPYNNKAL